MSERMRERRRRVTPEPTAEARQAEAPAVGAWRSAPGHHSLSAFDILPSGAPGGERSGPFATSVNDLLGGAFGQSLEGVELVRDADVWNDSLGTVASTIGRRIMLSSRVAEDVNDADAMDVLAHEVSHALAPAASPSDLVDSGAADPGERAARTAGTHMRDYVSGGGNGPVPELTPASGGQATVHRWGTGEHKDSVDNAANLLGQMGRPGGGAVDPTVARQLDANNQITLGNGVRVSAGEITALMGDFYGSFDQGEDGREHLNPQRSFQQLWNAPPEEMRALISLVRRDDAAARHQEGSSPVDEAEWEAVTAGRPRDQRSYLELAEVNDSHFSGPEMKGVDNNMGVYSIFHQMALAEAAKGTPEALNQARALEASASHYLTDRHASGHSFEKAGVMDAGGWTDTGGNLASKIVHDQYNEEGIDATNARGGPSWRALGDEHWHDLDNMENRQRTAESVYTSMSELMDVYGGNRTAAEVEKGGYGAYSTVPQWSGERQRAAERAAGDVGMLDKGGLILDEIGLAGPMAERWIDKKVDWADEELLQPAERMWDTATDWTDENVLQPAGEALDTATDWASENIGQPLGNAWDSASGVVDDIFKPINFNDFF